MKSNVVLASLIAVVSLQSGAFAQTAPEPAGDKPAAAASATPAADAGIAGAEKPKPKVVRRAAPAPEPSSMDRFSNFFRGNSNVQASAQPSAPG
ncbi:MAG: hypothetical protein ABUL48_02260, partial [Pseudorhodoplanes sp.]